MLFRSWMLFSLLNVILWDLGFIIVCIVFFISISVEFFLRRRASIWHWYVGCSWHWLPHRRVFLSKFRTCVSIGRRLLTHDIWWEVLLLMVVSLCRLRVHHQVLHLELSISFSFLQSSIQRIFPVPICWNCSLLGIYYLCFFSPPRWIY